MIKGIHIYPARRLEEKTKQRKNPTKIKQKKRKKQKTKPSTIQT